MSDEGFQPGDRPEQRGDARQPGQNGSNDLGTNAGEEIRPDDLVRERRLLEITPGATAPGHVGPPRTQPGSGGSGIRVPPRTRVALGESDPRSSKAGGVGEGGDEQRKSWRIGERLLAGVNWILTHLTSPAVTPVLIALGVYVIFNWGAVRVLPFDGDGGAALGLQLSRALDAIDAGARSGLDEDSTGVHAATSDAPNVTIPGANVSLTALLGLLGETQVQGVLVQEQTDATVDRKAAKGEVPPKPTYRVRLQVHGPNVSARFETDPKPSRDEAITAAAEQLYAELEPVTAAYYFFFRDPDRSLALVRRALADPTEPRRYDAHHVSGLILRNQLDNDGALEELSAALASTTKPAQQASIYLDMAYVAAADERWDDAMRYFDGAANAKQKSERTWRSWLPWNWSSKERTQWLVLSRKGDILRASGRLEEALLSYQDSLTLDATATDTWVGIGRVYVAQGNTGNAVAAFDHARRFAASKAIRGSFVRAVGDALVAGGCPAEGVKRYKDALEIDATYSVELAQPSSGQTCPYGRDGAEDVDASCSHYIPRRRG
jgi:tetratricopeptide (TPR) repeat protein